MISPNAMCSPPNPAAISQCPHAAGAAKATTPSAMKHKPMSGTTRTENAPPVATAVPYCSSQHPGSRAINPTITNTGVSTMPATSGGANASANRSAGTPDSDTPETLAFQTVAPSATTTATTASISHTATQRVVSSGGPEMTAVT